MPIISEARQYNGFEHKVERLDLSSVVAEVQSTLGFQLLVKESKHANGTQGLRKIIDAAFERIPGWTKITVGGTDWTKSNGRGATVGVEVQVSGRSDMLAVDIMHLKEDLENGTIDVGVIIVPDDYLSPFLTDRTPNYATAIKHVDDRASHLPISVIAFRHDGFGPALPKMRTNLGR